MLFCLIFAYACSTTEQSQTAVDTTVSSSESNAETKLSDLLVIEDYNGYDFQITTFQNNNFHYETDIEKMTGDVLDDAIYSRNRKIEEIYNITISQRVNVDWENYQTVKTNILANDSSFDLSIIRCGNDLDAWKNGYIYTFDNIPNIDMSKVYWDATLNSSLTINNVPYIAVGAFNLDIYDLTFCLLFNKGMVSDVGFGDLYEMVRTGVWTYDKMAGMMTSVRADLNGDGAFTTDDRFGYTSAAKMTANAISPALSKLMARARSTTCIKASLILTKRYITLGCQL